MTRRTRRIHIAALAAMGLLLALPGVHALDVAVELGGVSPLWDAEWRTPDGSTHQGITGEGVIALQREGIDASHPDLAQCSDPDHNIFDLSPPGTTLHVPSPITEYSVTSHGTLVTGVFCSRGDSTEGELKGVAPRATMFAVDRTANLGSSDLSDWYHDHNLKIFTDSTSGDSVELLNRLGLSDADLVLLDAVGNDGGSGSQSTTESHLNNDLRKVGVAAANKDRSDIAVYSSKGAKTDPATWPTITAPGCIYTTTQAQGHVLATYAYSTKQVATSKDCVTVNPEIHLQRTMNQYTQAAGTSFATPFTAGVFALVFEVNPDLNATESIHLVTRTADAFLETPGFEHRWQQTNETFFEEHGWQAGWGHVNATRAAAAAHYLLLNPEAVMEEALSCWSTGTTPDNRVLLNPAEEAECAQTSPESPQDDRAADGEGESQESQGPPEGSEDPTPLREPGTGASEEATTFPGWIIVIAATLLLRQRRRSAGSSKTRRLNDCHCSRARANMIFLQYR